MGALARVFALPAGLLSLSEKSSARTFEKVAEKVEENKSPAGVGSIVWGLTWRATAIGLACGAAAVAMAIVAHKVAGESRRDVENTTPSVSPVQVQAGRSGPVQR